VKRSAPLVLALAGWALGCRLGTDARVPLTAAPRLIVSPDSLAFRGRAGDSVLPDQYLSLSLDAKVSGRWQGFEDGSWFFLASGGDSLPYFLPVAPRPAGLAAGTYSASIWILAGPDTVRVPVTLRLDTALSLTGRWVASQDSTRLALDLADSAATLSGWGTTSPPERRVAVTGARSATTVALTLTAADVTFRFAGSLVDANAIAGTLTGGGLAALALTLYRQ
jgi:hypothetical protein